MSSQQGDTPLIMATKKEMVDAVKLLLDRGADISSKDEVNYLIQNTFNPNPNYFWGLILFENENNAFRLHITDMCNNTVVCNI